MGRWPGCLRKVTGDDYMMKFAKFFFITILGCFLWAGSAFSLALPGLNGDYEWNNSNYWSITDLSQGQGAFELTWENSNAAYDSSFGVYNVDVKNSSGTVTALHEIFDATAGPVSSPSPATTASVWFKFDNGSSLWQISDGKNGIYSNFGLQFGFYSDVYLGATKQYTRYTDETLNDDGLDYFFTAYDASNHNTKIYFEDAALNSSPVDLMISSSDLTPTPEPATLVLLGIGLLGIAGITRRKTN